MSTSSRSSATWRRPAPRCPTCGAIWKGCATGSRSTSACRPSAPELAEFRLAELELPAELPLSLPSQLARQRPDIRSAEALLARAGAQVGVATANLYPQLTLSAQLGALATSPGDLFAGGNGFYLLGASLVQPLFRGGELQARRRSAVAAYEQAGAAYQETVLQALQNVADVLRALEADAARLKERADAEERRTALARHHREAARRPAASARPPCSKRRASTIARMLEQTAGRRRPLRRLGRAAAGARRRLVAGGQVSGVAARMSTGRDRDSGSFVTVS